MPWGHSGKPTLGLRLQRDDHISFFVAIILMQTWLLLVCGVSTSLS
jgi:hypothetical protein